MARDFTNVGARGRRDQGDPKKYAPKTTVVVDQDAELLAAVPELLAVRDDSMTIREWMATLIPFFTTAKQLEVEAKTALELARTLKMPTNGVEDTALQVLIRDNSGETKKAEAHWQVTALVYNFQRRLVTVRKRTTDAREEVARIAQGLHNRYTEQENQRVQVENRRRQKEADDKLEAERQAELDRIEQEAVKAEAGSKDLSERERIFVEQIVTPTATRHNLSAEAGAASYAGFKDPVAAAARLMKTPKILGAIDNARTAKALREQAAAKREVPVPKAEIQEERPDIGGGGSDRTTRSMEIFDAAMFRNAVIGGFYDIPKDCLAPDQVKCNDYARQYGEVINRWPGVRLKKKTTTV